MVRHAPEIPKVEVIGEKRRIRPALLAVVACVVVAVVAAIVLLMPRSVTLDASAFPDDAVRAQVAAQADADADGKLSAREIAAVESLAFSDASDLAGIERFSNLTSLDLSQSPQVAALDVSAFAKLAQLTCGDDVQVSGLDATQLREEWLLDSFTLEGRNGIGEMRTEARTMHLEATYEYDDERRVIRKVVSERDAGDPSAFTTITTYAYDDAGRLATLDRSSSASSANDSVAFRYEDGRVVGYDGTASATVGYQDGRVTSIAHGSYTPQTFAYDDAGHLTSASSGSAEGSSVAYSYDAAGRVTALDWMSAGERLGGLKYTYDDAGRLTSRAFDFELMGAYEDVFRYDAAGHLVQAERGDTAFVLNYDSYGNLVSYGDSDGRSTVGRLSYHREFVAKDAPASAQLLRWGDPLLEVHGADPCDFALLSGQDPIVAYDGDWFAVL